MSQFKHIAFELRQAVAILTLNRPDVLNSFNRLMASEALEALRQCQNDSHIRAVLLTGAGRAFCAGQDLAEVTPEPGKSPQSLGKIVRECYNPIILALRNLEKPVICAVNGVAAGAGANLALACDIVFASNAASFIQSFSKIGLIPDSGGTFTLPRLVGMARATAMTMLGEKVSAEEAARIGMIYKTIEPEKLLETALALASELSTQPTRGFALTKRGLNASFTSSLERQLEMEADLQDQAGKTADYSEGVSAFIEKRKPAFKGK